MVCCGKKIITLLCLSLSQAHFVTSGVLFDKITSGIVQGRQRVSCGFQLVTKNFEHNQQNNPCSSYETVTKKVVTAGVGTHTGKFEVFIIFCVCYFMDVIFSESPTVKSSPLINPTETSSTEKMTYATVSHGKRIIITGANCFPGQRGDGKGHCRDEDKTR